MVNSCFGQKVQPDFQTYTKNFEDHYRTLVEDFGITISLIHVILKHVAPFCEIREHRFGYYSEQAVESIHCNFFNESWNRFKVSKNNKSYAEYLKKPVINFNGKNLVNEAKNSCNIFTF